MRFFDVVLDILFPPKCMFCGGSLPVLSKLLTCAECIKTLPFTKDNGCFEGIGDVSYVISPFFYAGPVKNAIKGYKFKSRRVYADSLAHFLGGYLSKIPDIKDVDLVTAVPLGKKRLKQRGFNQSELIAKKVSGMLGLKYDTDILSRVRETQKQSGLDTPNRISNVKDAFGCIQAIENMTILLIDDIYTTGATALSCAKALKNAGAKKVILAVLATASNRPKRHKTSNRI